MKRGSPKTKRRVEISKVAAEVDVYQLTHRLLQRTQEMGGRIYDRTVMDSYELRPDGATVKTAEGMTVRAKWVVFAAEIVRDSLQGKTHPGARLFRFEGASRNGCMPDGFAFKGA